MKKWFQNRLVLYATLFLVTTVLSELLVFGINQCNVHHPYLEIDGHNTLQLFVWCGLAVTLLIHLLVLVVDAVRYPLTLLLWAGVAVALNSLWNGERAGVANVPILISSLAVYAIGTMGERKKWYTYLVQTLFYLASCLYSLLFLSSLYVTPSGCPGESTLQTLIGVLLITLTVTPLLLQLIPFRRRCTPQRHR